MRLSDRGAKLIANFEGFRSCPYRDPVGMWTIGFGTTKGVGPRSKCITRKQALARMKSEINQTYGKAVNDLPVKLNQNQHDALVSFVYNVGPGGIGKDTGVGQALRRKDWKQAADELLEWNKAGGRVLGGLVRRRKAERELFLTEPPPKPIKWSAAERRRLRTLQNGEASRAQKQAAREWLEDQQRRISVQAKRPGGWERYDRGRRRRGIARVLEGKQAQWW